MGPARRKIGKCALKIPAVFEMAVLRSGLVLEGTLDHLGKSMIATQDILLLRLQYDTTMD